MRLARVADGHTVRVIAIDAERGRVLRTVPGDDDPILALLRDSRGLAEAATEATTGEVTQLDTVTFLPPLRRPGKIVAVGLNYPDHTSETGFEPPTQPLTFAKYASSLTGAYADVVVPTDVTSQADYEAELAVVIGTECPPDGGATLDDVAAYAVANDVSARDVQFRDTQWTRGKSFDTFTPFGPALVTADEVSDPQGLAIDTWINGEVVQSDSTASMVFELATLLRHINTGIRLEPGDVILTGTPAGAGAFLDPPRYLTDGDVVEITIDGIGTLRNTVTAR